MAFNLSLKHEINKEWKNNGLGKIALQKKVLVTHATPYVRF
jgi:hypothetical protein